MKVKSLISTPVKTCTLNADIAQARDLMKLNKISALPVVDLKDGQAIVEGIISIHDLAGVYDDNIKVKQVMTRQIYAVTPDTSIEKAAQVMIDKRIHHLLVMEDGEELVGIISALDFVNIIAKGE